MSIYAFDIDGTICNNTFGKYDERKETKLNDCACKEVHCVLTFGKNDERRETKLK